MVTFDHREPGTPASTWRPFLDELDARALDPRTFGSLVVVAPHPDDETLGAGGTIAMTADAGVPVHVIALTRGEGSHPDSPTHSPDRLAATRENEFRAALHTLHPGIRGTVLGLPDTGLREHAEELRRAVTAVVQTAPAPVLVVGPWGGDGHRDHRIAAEVTEEVCQRLGVDLVEYPIWMWHWDEPGSGAAPWARARTVRLDAEVRTRKLVALATYASQTGALSDAPGDEAIIDMAHTEHFAHTREVLFDAPPAPVPVPTAGAEAQTGTTGTAPSDPTTTAGSTAADPTAADPSSATDSTTAATGSDPGAASPTGPSRPRASFDAHYARRPEGWDFAGSWYERRKRAVTLAALPSERYRSALEVGCATGVLTRELTARADSVLGIDIAEAPLDRARSTASAATFARMSVPEEWPEGRFDLVVLSEVAYYLSASDLDRLIDRIAAALDDDGVLVACHWRHPDTEAPSSGDAVHARLRERWGRPALLQHVEEDFVLEVFPGPDVLGVARAEGITP